MPRSTRAKTRTKTFTGCWTCRLRRLKCDEARPECTLCVEKGIECGGYSTRLQWLPPNRDVFAKTSSKGEGQRRRLLPAAEVPRLTDGQVEAAIADIEQAAPVCRTESRGPFSVFRIDGGGSQQPSAGGPADQSDDLEFGCFPAMPTFEIGDDDYSQPATDGMPSSGSARPWPPSPEQLAQPPRFPCIVLEPFSSPPLVSGASQTEDDTSSERNSMDFGLTIDQDLFFRPAFLTIQVKHLLDHYSKNVLRIFSILDNKNTPWSSFHLPRALQCCSELEVVGRSTPARSALLHAILSVSAYNLQCRHASQNQEAVARKWAEIGSKYRMQALDFLKTSAGDPLVATANSEYKELLAAMLSMVTIDVVSGDTRTCGIHLNGCESLIRARKRAVVKISSKTKALHRIFFYLRVMQDATELTCNAFQSSDHERGEHGRAGPDDFETYLDPYEQLADEEFDSASYELIYGLPQSLLVLVHKTCKLLQKMNRADAVAFQRLLMPACDQLEEEILDWPVEEEVAKLERARMDKGNCMILQHHMRAFHNAAIIFFCRNIRFMNRRHLQQYVKAVIHHLDEIEKIKEKEMINAGPLLWPAFVAGEQAIDSATRAQLVGWFNRIEQHGVATAKLTRASLEEIWERAARNHSQVPISVLHTQLMLT